MKQNLRGSGKYLSSREARRDHRGHGIERASRYLAESCENVRDWKQKIASVDIFSGPDQVLIENIFAIQEDIIPTNRADMFK